MPIRSVVLAVVTALLLAVSRPAASAPASITPASTGPTSVYPGVGAGTDFLDDDAYLQGFNDPDWYRANIPFVDLPDQQIQDVYYYRWRVWKEHLRYTNPADGWVLTEFLDCCGYAAPYQAINAAAAHHIADGRWVRDRRYVDDYLKFWLTGPGQRAQNVNQNAPDWAHEYSFWAADAAYARAEVTGDWTSVKKLLPAMIRQYDNWNGQYDAEAGLYWQLPVWDAKELSPASYQSSDRFGGVKTFRPSINAYQYGDALAISRIAAKAGDTQTAQRFADRAARLRQNTIDKLWDPERKFFYDVVDENNPTRQRLDTREDVGFVPWQSGLAEPGQSEAWAQLTDPQGFAAPYGPTTTERRSSWFMHEALQGCCRWDGPSWPYSTAQILTGFANLLNDYPAQPYVDGGDYFQALRTYALTQYRDGKPYVAEAHHPDEDRWIYDGSNHSEDYLHSTYPDLVLSGLLGLRPQEGAALRINPLVPPSWDHFAVENVPYHGRNVTVLWDRDGSHYGQGAGMRVYVDGRLVRTAATLRPMTIGVEVTEPATTPHLVNDAANPLRTGYPRPIASYTWRFDNPWSAVDGKVWFNEVPQNTRWTNWSSPNAHDYYGVDFGGPTPVGDIRWYGYDDGGGVRPAAGYRLEYWTGDAWAEVPGQVRSPSAPAGNGLNRITFPALTTSKVRIVFDNPAGAFVGVTEFQSWSEAGDALRLTVDPATVKAEQGAATELTTTVRNDSGAVARDVRNALQLPSGWTATAQTPVNKDVLAPGGVFSTRWSLSPATVAPCDTAVLAAVATADVGGTPTGSRVAAPVEVSPDPAEPHGLKGDYYLSSAPGAFDFGEYKASTVDPVIDFGDLEPVFQRLTGRTDDVTVRWTGQLEPRYSETYTFSMIGDNGFRLWVDGRLVIDNWADNWDVEMTGTPITLQAGHRYDLKIEYFEHYGGSNLHLSWQSPSQFKDIVPTCALHPSA